MLRGTMAPKLTGRERQVLELVQDLGAPHVLEILGVYHRRYEEPIEAASLVLALRRLLEKGLVSAQSRPAPPGAAIDERVHFQATRRARQIERSGPAVPPQPASTGVSEELLRILQLTLEEARRPKPSTSRPEAAARRS